MRLAAYAVLSSVAILATADAVAPVAGLTSEIVRGGAVAILGSVIWYLLTRTFPAQTAALKDQREAFLRAMDDRRTETRELIAALTRDKHRPPGG